MIHKTLHNKQKIEQDKPPQKSGSEFESFGRVSSSSCTSGTPHLTLVKNLMESREWRKGRIVIMPNETYLVIYDADIQ